MYNSEDAEHPSRSSSVNQPQQVIALTDCDFLRHGHVSNSWKLFFFLNLVGAVRVMLGKFSRIIIIIIKKVT